MSRPTNYTAELEYLILNTLLPVYEKYHKQNKLKMLDSDINPELLKQIKRKKVLPALLKPKETWA
jgi:F0F1-type ATP synthase alpha subunit